MATRDKILYARVEQGLWDRLEAEAARRTEETGYRVTVSDIVFRTLREAFPGDGTGDVVPRARIERATP